MNKKINKIPIEKLKTTIFSTLILLLIGGGLYGCGSKKPIIRKNVTFRITSEADINNAQPVYIVIRKVNKKKFLVENYDEIAELVYADPPDDSVLAWKAILPEKKEKVKVAIPSKSDIGIYGMFTQPDENWKTIINSPFGKKYDILIKDKSIKYRKKGFWVRIKELFKPT